MKIQKSLLAVIAMAGTMGFSAVASAMDFSVYGSLRGGVTQSSSDAYTPAPVPADETTLANLDTTAAGYTAPAKGTEVKGKDSGLQLGHGQFGSRIGIRGSEDLGNGAEAGLHWEARVGPTGSIRDQDGRHANVWYSGAFGKITIGQQGNPYRNAANWDQSWWYGGNNRYGDGGSRLQGIRYDGSAGAFNWSVMATAEGVDDDVFTHNTVTGDYEVAASTDYHTYGTATAAAGATPRAIVGSEVTVEKAEIVDETGVDSWIATGHYDMGVATINLGYRVDNVPTQELGTRYDNFVISANGSLDALDWYIAFEQNTDNADIKATTAHGDIPGTGNAGAQTAAEVAQQAEAARRAKLAQDAYSLQDTSTIGLFLNYNISDVSQVYMEWEDSASDGFDGEGVALDKNAVLLGFSRKIGPNTSFIAEYVTVDYNSDDGDGGEAADNNTISAQMKVDF